MSSDVESAARRLVGTWRAATTKRDQDLFEAEPKTSRAGEKGPSDKLRGTTSQETRRHESNSTEATGTVRGIITLGKAGGAATADAEAMGRLISLALRSGIPLPSIHRQLRGISSDRAVGLGPNKVLSVPDAIGIALEEWWRDKHQGVQAELLPPDTRQAGIPALEQIANPVSGGPEGSGGSGRPRPEQRWFDMSGTPIVPRNVPRLRLAL